jgi:hypothetical protein
MNIKVQLKNVTKNIQLQLDNTSPAQLGNSPQNLQLRLDDSTRIFQLQLENLISVTPQSLTMTYPNQTHPKLNGSLTTERLLDVLNLRQGGATRGKRSIFRWEVICGYFKLHGGSPTCVD